jgi:DNA-binding HxlR family transcriptional regulator
MRRVTTECVSECPAETTLRVIGGSWKVLVLFYLFGQVKRYSELQRDLKGITPKMLTQQLRELECDGILHRRVYPEVPPRVEYSLTPLGQSLKPIVDAMCDWGFKHRGRMKLTQEDSATAPSNDFELSQFP